MKIHVNRGAIRQILRGCQYCFLIASVSLLGWCGYVLVDTWMFQRQEQLQMDALLNLRSDAHTESDRALLPTAVNGLIGRVEIPRLGISVMVVEGTDNSTLRRAAGHVSGTAFPGEPGNVGISAHRDTFFRPLRNIQKEDIVTLTTLRGEFRYRVVSSKVVTPDDVTVLDPGDSEVLTLVTCYPFYFVGAAPDRFIVRAERIAVPL